MSRTRVAGALSRRPRHEAGIVTAETALTLPALIAVAVALAWVVSLGATQARAQDAAREAARLIARGDDVERARRAALHEASAGSTVVIDTTSDEVIVTVRSPSRAPLLGIVGPTLQARSISAVEQGS